MLHEFCWNGWGSEMRRPFGSLWSDGRVPLILGGEKEQILIADMEIQEIDRVRSSINIYRDRRPEVYQL